MAIQLDIESSYVGIPFTGAYFRIARLMIIRQDNPKFTVIMDVLGYATHPADENVREVDSRRYTVDLDVIEAETGDAFLQKCYVWVMAQPDMAGAIAV